MATAFRVVAAALALTGCVAQAAETNCGPAPESYLQATGSSCLIEDGGVFRLPDGRAAPRVYVCTEDGAVVESWCQP